MMDRKDKETEKLLQTLRPASPSEALRSRIEADIEGGASGERKTASRKSWWYAASLVAASVAALIYLGAEREEGPLLEAQFLEESVLPPPRVDGDLKRIRGSSYLLGVEEGPVYLDENGQPVRDTVIRYRDTEIYERLSDGQEVKITSIREEKRRERVSAQ